MMEGIDISLEEVTRTAAAIRTLNKNISVKLEGIKTQMKNLSAYWQSEAADSIKARFDAYSPKFDDYSAVVESYAKFLDYTVTRYDTEETIINNNANAFQ